MPSGDFEGLGPRSYVPIEWFKSMHRFGFDQPTERIFHSSGTGGEQSEVGFSKEGLAQYRFAAVDYFSTILETQFGDFSVPGFSLIPPPCDWPDSSLAQMIAWFQDEFNLQYIQTIADLPTDQPIWLFGTVAHFVDVMIAEKSIRLHPKSLIFETGGSKNIGIEKNEFYKALKSFFHVHANQIFSEYGMCELASQAYGPGEGDWSFASEVQCFVQKADGNFYLEGTGCLTVYDPARRDCPHPIRTQDLVTLANQEFRYLHRLKTAPLKGCSLLVDEVVNDQRSSIVPLTFGTRYFSYDESSQHRSQKIEQMLDQFLIRPEVVQTLAQEIGSLNSARLTLEELRKNVLSCNWKTVCQNATQSNAIAEEWFFILPDNHSLVGCYPLVVAYILGLTAWVRVPSSLAKQSFLALFLRELMALSDSHFRLIPSYFKVGASPLPQNIGSILCYGTDDTITTLHKISPVPVLGFGNSLIALYTESLDQLSANRVIEEAFSLGQKGCLSARLLICEKFEERDIHYLQKAFEEYWQANLAEETQLSLHHRFLQLQFGSPFQVHWRPGTPLFPHIPFERQTHAALSLDSCVSQTSFELPILTGMSPARLSQTEIEKLSRKGLRIFPLAARPAHPVWDGYHQNKPLFVRM